MLCLLMRAVKDPKRVYEVHEGNYCFKFGVIKDYKCTVEYYVSHFLVHEGKARVGKNRMLTLRISTVDRGSSRWKGADVLIFNTAHWWSHYKTKSGMFANAQFCTYQLVLSLQTMAPDTLHTGAATETMTTTPQLSMNWPNALTNTPNHLGPRHSNKVCNISPNSLSPSNP